MSRERLYLFDTTLRDGAQTNGVDFTLQDKRLIAGMLDELGVDYIEGGYPGANPIDTEFFAEDRKLAATFTAFGMVRRPGRSTSNDPGLATLLAAEAEARSRQLHGVRHDPASRPFGVERPRSRGAAGGQGGCDLLCREIVGLSGPRRARDHQRRKPRLDP